MADLSPVAAFVAGTVSFLSPCVLPLVPGYVSLISGTTIDELQGTAQPSGESGAAVSPAKKPVLGSVMLKSVMFIMGFSLVFISLGATATKIGQVTQGYHKILAVIAGAVIFIFGLHLTGLLQIKALYADKRMHSVGGSSKGSVFGAFLVGFAFAFLGRRNPGKFEHGGRRILRNPAPSSDSRPDIRPARYEPEPQNSRGR